MKSQTTAVEKKPSVVDDGDLPTSGFFLGFPGSALTVTRSSYSIKLAVGRDVIS